MVHEVFEWGRLNEPWTIIAGMVLGLGVLALAASFARREAAQQSSLRMLLLWTLRGLSIAALIIWLLQPQWRIHREQVRPSKVLLLVDTSASMALPVEVGSIRGSGPGSETGGRVGVVGVPSRLEAVIQNLQGSQLVEQLSGTHEVLIYQFGESSPRLVGMVSRRGSHEFNSGDSGGNAYSLGYDDAADNGSSGRIVDPAKEKASGGDEESARNGKDVRGFGSPPGEAERWWEQLQPMGRETRLAEAITETLRAVAGDPVAGVIVCSDGGQNAGQPVAVAIQAAREARTPIYTIGVGPKGPLVDARIAELQVPRQAQPADPFQVVVLVQGNGLGGAKGLLEVGLKPETSPETQHTPTAPSRNGLNADLPAAPSSAGEFGDNASNTSRRDPTDNTGSTSANASANDSANIPLETAGNTPANDSGENSANNFASVPAGSSGETARETGGFPGGLLQVQRTEVGFSNEGGPVSATFEFNVSTPGRYRVVARLQAQPREQDVSNNVAEMSLEVLERETRVLLLAGGPSREYQFLRGVLYREPRIRCDILLQSAQPGTSQEANALLEKFPESPGELAAYDCVIGIDPDWGRLRLSAESTSRALEALQSWVAEQAGGLIVVAGPVCAGDTVRGWLREPVTAKIRELYPVELLDRQGLTITRMHHSEEPWPIEFTREGLAATYLWLEPSGAASQAAWSAFPGVYSCFPARGLKPAALALAYFTDPQTFEGDKRLILLAEQFFGAGRVFYLGSGELWRLRSVKEGYFERLYLQLIRHVSQGRAARQSPRGLLLVDREKYFWGDPVTIHAQIADSQLRPFSASDYPIEVMEPDGRLRTLRMAAEPGRAGAFRGTFTVLKLGTYRIVSELPDAPGEKLLREIHVELPQLENQQLLCNEELLRTLSDATGGRYYGDWSEIDDKNSAGFLPRLLPDGSRVETIVGPAYQPSFRRCLELLFGQSTWFSWIAVVAAWWPWRALTDLSLAWWLFGMAAMPLLVQWTLRRLWQLA